MEIIILLALFVFVILLAEIWYYGSLIIEIQETLDRSREIIKEAECLNARYGLDKHKMLRTYAREE